MISEKTGLTRWKNMKNLLLSLTRMRLNRDAFFYFQEKNTWY